MHRIIAVQQSNGILPVAPCRLLLPHPAASHVECMFCILYRSYYFAALPTVTAHLPRIRAHRSVILALFERFQSLMLLGLSSHTMGLQITALYIPADKLGTAEADRSPTTRTNDDGVDRRFKTFVWVPAQQS